jgi:hypothetical protein
MSDAAAAAGTPQPPQAIDRAALRRANLNPTSSRAAHRELMKTLKSDMKKGSVFGRRFKAFTSDVAGSILQDLTTLNVNMYVSEAAQSAAATIAEGKLKPNDTVALAIACSQVHQRYEAFTPELNTQLGKALNMEDVVKEMKEKMDFNNAIDVSKLRATIRSIGELWLVGLVDGPGWLLKQVLFPLAQALESAPTAHHTAASLSITHSAMKYYGIEMTRGGIPGITPSETDGPELHAAHQQRLADARSLPLEMANPKHAESAVKLFTALCDKALDMCRKLRRMVEEQYKKVCESTELRGADGNAEAINKFETVHNAVVKLIGMTDSLSVALGRGVEQTAGLPDLKKAAASSSADQSVVITSRLAEFYAVTECEHVNHYDDDEQRAFYEDLLAIDHLLPDDNAVVARKIAEDEEEERTALDYTAIEALIEKLPHCAAAKYADAFVEDFLTESTKYFREAGTGGIDQARAFFTNCRKKLNTELRYARTNATEMLPFYSRIVATLNTHFPDTAETLVSKVNADLLATVKGKTSGVRGKKKRAGRYIAELTKFRVCPPRNVLRVLQVLTEELDGENASIWAGVVEAVGSFLMRGGVTKEKFVEAVAAFKKKRNATTNISTVIDDEIEMALNAVKDALKPRGTYKPVEFRPRTLVEQYARHLLFTKLDRHTIDGVCGAMLRLPWQDPVEGPMLVRTVRKVHHCSWHNIHLLAEVIATVSDEHGWVGSTIGDMVLESLRTDLEFPANRTQQRRLQDAKFLAELFNYRLLSASMVLYVLAQITLYFPAPSPPKDYSRLRAFCLVMDCTTRYLLPVANNKDTAQQQQHQASIAANLSVTLAFFYRLVHTRAKPVPHDIDFRLSELLRLVDNTLNRKKQVLAFPSSLAKADELLVEYGFTSVKANDRDNRAHYASLRALVAASKAPVPSIRDADLAAVRAATARDAVPGSIYPVFSASGGARTAVLGTPQAVAVQESTGFEEQGAPVATPLDQRVAEGGNLEGDEDSTSDDSDDDDDDSDEEDDEEESDEEDDDDDDDEPAQAPQVADDAALFKREGRFAIGGSWLAMGRQGASRSGGAAATVEEREQEEDFDRQLRDVLKESTADASAKVRAGGMQQLERTMEQKLGGRVLSLAKNATLAPSARTMLANASAGTGTASGNANPSADSTPATGVRMAVLRRGQGDKPEARAVLVPTSEFTKRLHESQQAHRDEASALKAHTLAMTRASEAAEGAAQTKNKRR